jgi:hypothetical protein
MRVATRIPSWRGDFGGRMFHHIITMGINGIMAIIALSKKVFDLGRPNDQFGANHAITFG